MKILPTRPKPKPTLQMSTEQTSNEVSGESLSSDQSTSPRIQTRMVVVALLLLTTLVSGSVHAYLDGRFVNEELAERRADAIAALPTSFGAWKMVSEEQLDETAADLLRPHGSIVRNYRNSETGATVKFAMILGPRGPIAVHTPEICYRSSGNTPSGARRVTEIKTDQQTHQAWSLEFKDRQSGEASLHVLYAWSDGGAFVAAEQPRFWMVDNLYKIQLASPSLGDDANHGLQFLRDFMPHLEKSIL